MVELFDNVKKITELSLGDKWGVLEREDQGFALRLEVEVRWGCKGNDCWLCALEAFCLLWWKYEWRLVSTDNLVCKEKDCDYL